MIITPWVGGLVGCEEEMQGKREERNGQDHLKDGWHMREDTDNKIRQMFQNISDLTWAGGKPQSILVTAGSDRNLIPALRIFLKATGCLQLAL